MQSLEQLVKTCRKYIDLANTIEFKGLEALRNKFAGENSISLYRNGKMTTVYYGDVFSCESYDGKIRVGYDLGVDFENINKELSEFFDEHTPDFSLNYQKDVLRIELEQLEERRASIENILNQN